MTVEGAEDLIEQNGRPEWRWSATIRWRKDQWGAGYYTSYVGGVDDTSATLADGTPWRVDDLQTHNLYIQDTVDTDGPLDGTRLRFGGRNIFNEEPPLADSTLGYLGELHSPRGATRYASVRKRF